MKSLEKILEDNVLVENQYLVLINQSGKYTPRFYYGEFVTADDIMDKKMFMHPVIQQPIMGVYYVDMETEVNRFEQLRK